MIPLFKVALNKDQILSSLESIFDSGFIGQGKKVEEFEALLKKYLDVNLLLTVNSGTSAEHLFYHMMKSKFQNSEVEVLASPLTCTASNWPILANGFKIKWVDVNPNTLNMDLVDLERKITKTTKIILLVHWGGYPNDLDEVSRICDRAELIYGFRPIVIEDCAHAFGSEYKNKKIGNHGNVCTFSFQAIKHLTCGDGGALVLNNYDDARRGKLLRWYGIDRDENRKDFRCEADVAEWGFKFHMNDINATIGIENMKLIDSMIKTNRSNAAFFNSQLSSVSDVELLENKLDRNSSYWLYTIKVDDQQGFMSKMKEKGIMVSRVHERNDKHTCVKQFKSLLPNLDKVIQQMICIPVGWWVSQDDRQYIVNCIKEGW